ncbi:HAD-like domain-containing protein [Jimgerdemannia flammicorona]|uniref:HAD-like domain-containing protein n=1 Tax=Jimgerdemannia flammicorona TaxID=994334 RepID=A0A433CZA0_9FUNG|nr:HAD-like domain-containing protein [Jimgerdemannia flammicorona]
MPHITHCIFDMDGLLIDTERIYTEVTQEILDKYVPGATFTWDIKSQMMGANNDVASKILIDAFNLPLTSAEYLKLSAEIQEDRFPDAQPLPGVMRLIAHLKRHKIPIAVATSSTRAKFLLKSSKNADLFSLFDHIICGDDEGIRNGKPAPDLFLAARDRLGAPPAGNCLVFEDAINGVQAGLAAGMHVCWVPDPRMFELHGAGKDHGATLVLDSLEHFNPEQFALPALTVTAEGPQSETIGAADFEK